MSKRKSEIGSRSGVCEPPPHPNGKPWWTAPPVAPPEPRHIAYAREYRAQLVARQSTTRGAERAEVDALMGLIREWLKRANTLAAAKEAERCGLTRPDDLLVEANRLVERLLKRAGGWAALDGDWERAVAHALSRRGREILARRSGRHFDDEVHAVRVRRKTA